MTLTHRNQMENQLENQTQFSSKELASKIDHTLLKADATSSDIERLCNEARQYHFATVCVNAIHIAQAVQCLKGSEVKVAAVVGFPLGSTTTRVKAFEAAEAIQLGAQEIDMVIALGALKEHNDSAVLEDIRQVVLASHPYPVKVILETASLTQSQKIRGCELAKEAGAAFVKTSTGFGAGGATVEDVALMRKVIGSSMGVKASGGVRTHEDAVKMLQAGASRLGTSAGVEIVKQKLTAPTSSY